MAGIDELAAQLGVSRTALMRAAAGGALGVAVLFLLIGNEIDNGPFRMLGTILLLAGVLGLLVSTRNPAPPAPTPLMSTTPVPDAVRQQRLQEYLSAELARSQGRIESVAPYSAVIITGQKVNHVLHLLVSVLLCGLWLPVWLLIAVSGGEQRRVLTVDPYGNVTGR